MSMINKFIMDTLLPLGVPIEFQKYSGDAKTYITFHEYLQEGDGFEDDIERIAGHYVQIDVWSITDYIDLVRRVKNLLAAAGCYRLGEADFFEPETGIYHKGIKVYLLELKEE